MKTHPTFNQIQVAILKEAREKLIAVVITTPRHRPEYEELNKIIQDVEHLLLIF